MSKTRNWKHLRNVLYPKTLPTPLTEREKELVVPRKSLRVCMRREPSLRIEIMWVLEDIGIEQVACRVHADNNLEEVAAVSNIPNVLHTSSSIADRSNTHPRRYRLTIIHQRLIRRDESRAKRDGLSDTHALPRNGPGYVRRVRAGHARPSG